MNEKVKFMQAGLKKIAAHVTEQVTEQVIEILNRAERGNIFHFPYGAT